MRERICVRGRVPTLTRPKQAHRRRRVGCMVEWEGGGRRVGTGSTTPPNTAGLNGRGGWYWVPSPHSHHPHALLLPTHPNHPLLSACHPACPPTCHPTAVEETTCNRTSITFPRTTISYPFRRPCFVSQHNVSKPLNRERSALEVCLRVPARPFQPSLTAVIAVAAVHARRYRAVFPSRRISRKIRVALLRLGARERNGRSGESAKCKSGTPWI